MSSGTQFCDLDDQRAQVAALTEDAIGRSERANQAWTELNQRSVSFETPCHN